MAFKLINEDIFPVLIEFGVDTTVTIDLLHIIQNYISDYIDNDKQHNQQKLESVFHTLIKKHGVVLEIDEEEKFKAKLIAIGNLRYKEHEAGILPPEIMADIEAPPADDSTQVIQTMLDAEFETKMAESKTDSEKVQLVLQKLGYSRLSELHMKQFMLYIRIFIDMVDKFHDSNQDRIREKTMRTLRSKVGKEFMSGRERIFFDFLNRYVACAED